MASAATVSILMLLILGLVLAGFVVGIVLWATGGRRTGGEMACGRCGYSVRGLEQFTCPECGADLRTVGISGGTSGGRRVTGIVLTAVCGLILLSCVGMGAVGFLFAAAPTPVHQRPLKSTTTTIQSQQVPSPVPPAQVDDPVDIREVDPVNDEETLNE